jgi:uncharacterized protein involved in cysteine biosynthesis
LRVLPVFCIVSGMPTPKTNASMGRLSVFVDGFRGACRGPLRVLSDRRSLLLSIIPMIVHGFLFAALLWLGLGQRDRLLSWLPDLPSWLQALAGIFAATIIGLLSFVAAILVGSVICDPLYDLLSERTEERRLGRAIGPPMTITTVVRGIARELSATLLRTAVYLAGAVPLLLLGLTPLTVVTTPMSMLWTWLFLAYEYLSRSFIRHGVPPSARLAAVRHEGWYAAGFGAGAALLSLLPLTAPLLVVAGTDAYLDLAAEDRMPHRLNDADRHCLQAGRPS